MSLDYDDEHHAQALRDIDNLYRRPLPNLPHQTDSVRLASPPLRISRPREYYTANSFDSTTHLVPGARQGNCSPIGAQNQRTSTHLRSNADIAEPYRQHYQSAHQVEFFAPIEPWDIESDEDHEFSRGGAPAKGSRLSPKMIVASLNSGRVTPNDDGSTPSFTEKSASVTQQGRGRGRSRCIIWSVIVAVVVLGVIGGIIGGVLASRKSPKTSSEASSQPATSSSSSDSSTSSSLSSSSSDGLYDLSSPEVKSLLNNKNLHRVFPGMDYTPLNAQYPACLSTPPTQNNVTLDIAVLSQLTPTIRLYGTDCNQTELVLSAITTLALNSTLKVWLGVWLSSNATTNTRQLAQMYDILATYPSSHFAGVIVGNEVLYREDMTLAELSTTIQGVKTNLTNKGIDLPVGTSDLGDNWTAELAAATDIVMANVHPFFAGVTAQTAAAWTWEFWTGHDVSVSGDAADAKTSGTPRNVISEVGWPSQGGKDDGDGGDDCDAETCAVAGVAEMNTFLESWVCESLTNGTTYFWFEAFDEPWKVIYNTDVDQWETHWGLFGADRQLKANVTIPDCAGRVLS